MIGCPSVRTTGKMLFLFFFIHFLYQKSDPGATGRICPTTKPGGGNKQMILSVSRRTDIPALYMDWFVNRLRAGWLLVRNPFQRTRVSRIPLGPDAVDCIVFWTKNPRPLLACLETLRPWPYIVQVTVNPYGREMESGLPPVQNRLDAVKRLAERIGSERVVWRYSPILLSRRYTAAFHAEMFGCFAERLAGATCECKLSFLDMYPKIARRMRMLGVDVPAEEEALSLARCLSGLAREQGIRVRACGPLNLEPAGVAAGPCIDGQLIERLVGRPLRLKRDTGQRAKGCLCVESVDVGAYQTCVNGCAYCYANHSHAAALRRAAAYDPDAPLLCDRPGAEDMITERRGRHPDPAQDRPLLPGL